MRRRILGAAGLVLTVAGVAAGWWFLAPPPLGGRTSYAVTFGVSMEPHFTAGDLVLLRKRPAYSVGDVVAYRSDELHRNVLHRIVADRGGRFSFKGDNNGFVDPEHPTSSAVLGSEWLRIPRVGGWLATLHTPRNAAIAAGIAALVLLAGGGGTATRRRRRRGDDEDRPRAVPRAAPSLGFTVAGAGAGVLVAAAVLGGLSFTRALERGVVEPDAVVQHGRFSYETAVKPGATYQSDTVRTGQPVYLRLVRRLPISFAYSVEGRRTDGTTSLAAYLEDGQGWRHRIGLGATDFHDSAATAHGVLDLRRLQRVIAAFERETGEHNTLYHLTLQASVRGQGLAPFTPSLGFDLDSLRLAVAMPAEETPDPFAFSASGAGMHTETATLGALGRSVPVARARHLATVGGLLGLGLTVVGGLLLLLARRGQEVHAIRRRYEDWIVDVIPIDRSASEERRVASMDALARIAEQYDRVILHERRREGDAFLIEDDGIVYTYLAAAS